MTERAKNYLWGLGVILVCLAVLGAVFYPHKSHAAGSLANVSWTLPSCYNDGALPTPPATGCGTASPFPASDILSVTVKWTGTVQGQVTLTGAVSSTQVPVACGNVSFVVFVTPKPSAKFPSASPDSDPAMYASGVQCRPLPPTAVTAN